MHNFRLSFKNNRMSYALETILIASVFKYLIVQRRDFYTRYTFYQHFISTFISLRFHFD